MLYRARRRGRIQTKAGSKKSMEKAGQQRSSVTQQKHEREQSIAELDAQDRPHELSDTNARSELEGAFHEST
jgi:hypothetical protein